MKMLRELNVGFFLPFFLLLNLIEEFNGVAGPCIYDIDSRGVIDLTTVGRNDAIPRWKNQHPTVEDDYVYSYNPCYSFSQSSCKDAAACQIDSKDEEKANLLGTQSSLQWNIVEGQPFPTLTYSTGEKTLHVNLICLNKGEADNLQVYGYESTTKSFIMILSSKCVCWNGCKHILEGPDTTSTDHPDYSTTTHSPTTNPISAGTIFILFLFSLIFVYLSTFILWNKYQKQQTGLNLIPHRTFWICLFNYSFDGFRFLFKKLNIKSQYNSIT